MKPILFPLIAIFTFFSLESHSASAFKTLLAYTPEYEATDPLCCDAGLLLPETLDPSLTNLEKNPQNFILETKKIEFSGFPGAFNPSITRFDGSLLMIFRVRDPKTSSTSQMAIVQLNDNFDPIAPPQILDVPIHNSLLNYPQQDPRLIPIGDRLFMVYSSMIKGNIVSATRRVLFAELRLIDGNFVVDTPECITQFEGERELRWEKNWTPFDYQGNLLLAYSQIPHRIFLTQPGTGACTTVCETTNDIQWEWGVLRGGSQAILDNGQYLTFFHSSTNMATTHSQGKVMQHYFMGAYTFSAEPPFAITQISKEPIVGKNFYTGPAHKTWKPLRVVFPGGIVADDHFVWVAYGRQDHEIWVVKIDKKGLYESLIPVSQNS